MEEAGDAADVDEGAVGLDGSYHAVDELAGLQVRELGLHHSAPVGHNQPVLGLINLEELEWQHLAHAVLRETLRGVGTREEAAQALEVDERAAPVDGHDLRCDGAVLRLHAPSGKGRG